MSRTRNHRDGPRTDPSRTPRIIPIRTHPFFFAMAGLLVAAAAFAADTPSLLADRAAWEVPPGAPHEAGRTGDALVVVDAKDIDDLWDFVDRWEEAGARFPHVYPPDILIGDVPASLESDLRGDARFVALHRDAVPVTAEKNEPRRWVADSWNAELAGAASAGKNAPAEPTGEYEELLFPNPVEPDPEEIAKWTGDLPQRYGSAYGATMTQTSELMMGKVAVSVVLPDAPGGSYASNEIPVVVSEARAAMDFWASVIGYPGVRFIYEVRSDVPTTRNFHDIAPHMNNPAWVNEIMNFMGYDLFLKNTEYGPVYEYLDSLRIGTRSEWGIVFFIPKITNFVGAGYTAYAFLGGPFLVVPSGQVRVHDGEAYVSSGSGGYRLSNLIIHESGHLFWALDEYPPGGTSQPCNTRSGYLAIPNKNSNYRDYTCDPHQVACCMDRPGPNACKYTLGMAGWWDSDANPLDENSGDGIPDILDTHPFVHADSLPDTITTVFPTMNIVAAVMPLPNQATGGESGAGKVSAAFGTRHDISFNTIEHVVYRIDNAVDDEGNPLWFYADPEGGFGDNATRVNFSFIPDSLTGGVHTIRLKAVNTVGNWSSWGSFEQTVFVKAIALHDLVAEPDYEGAVKLSYRIRGGTFGATGRLYRSVDGGEETLLRTFPLVENSAQVLYDYDQTPGNDYTYRLEGTALGQKWNWTASVIGPAPIDRGDHISRITPNPFRGSTMISVLVPRGELAERRAGGGGGKPNSSGGTATPPAGEGAPAFATASSKYQQVRVEVDIYNLAGRRVRHFTPIHSYEGFYSDPFVWDGNDDSGRALAQGIYFVRMKAGNDVRETRKVLLIK